MATKADIQNWQQKVYTQQYSLSNALTMWHVAPTNLTIPERKLEVLLFRAMMDYFRYYPGHCAAVIGAEETHQHYVCPLNQKPSCEVSDVLFVIFSRRRDIIRMTHLQAKRKKDVVLPIQQYPKFEFELDPRQYELLHNRLWFTNRGRSQYPEETFSHYDFSDSIASYGVFYIDNNNEKQFAYEVAPIVDKYKKKGTFSFVNDEWRYLNSRWMQGYLTFDQWWHIYSMGDCCTPDGELISTLDTRCFERELFRCNVGSRIKKNDRVGRELLDYIGNLLATLYNFNVYEDDDIFRTFEQFVQERLPERWDAQPRYSVLPGNIILINADRID